MVRRSAASEMWGCHELVCANVYGLCWSESLLARMECAALFSTLVIQSRETSSEFGFRERRVRPLCHLLIRQQTWQEAIISAVIAMLPLRQPTPGGRYGSFFASTAHAMRAGLFARATPATFRWVREVSWANHLLRPADCFVRCCRTARAPCTKSLRK
jgi:hypothetical protein